MRKIFLNLILLILLAAYGCGEIVEPTEISGYGIPAYHLKIDAEDYARFSANLFSNYAVHGKLEAGDKTYKVKIEHQGWSSRELYKHSYEINYTGGSDPLLNRSKIILSAQARDASMLRTLISVDAFNAAGLMTIKAEPAFLYINNEPQGLYIITEVITDEFFAARSFELNELFKAINTEAKFTFKEGFNVRIGFEKRIPGDGNYNSLESLIYLLDTEPLKTLPGKLEKKLDVENYLKYCAVTELIGNWDGIVHNFYLCSEENDRRLKFVPWDFDLTLSIYKSTEANNNLNKLFNKIISVGKYNSFYNSFLHELVTDKFTIDFASGKVEEYKNKINEAYYNDPLFGALKLDLNYEAEVIKNYFRNHPLYN